MPTCQSASNDLKVSFENYSPSTRLDTFYYNLLGNNREFKELLHFNKIKLMLTHDNAAVKSGFSVNEGM
jgi:hypothetical protein